MSATPSNFWHEANQRYLTAALAVVREALERHSAPHAQEVSEIRERDEFTEALRAAAETMPAPPALETLCAAFGLTRFERDLLLLCAGVELDYAFASLCATVQGDSRRAYPTFGLALASLPEAHWSALTPAAPLRFWRLVEVGTGDALTTSPLRIDERVLHYLTGVSHLDERLQGLVEPLSTPAELPPSHSAIARKVVDLWSQTGAPLGPVIQLYGGEDVDKQAIAAAAFAALGLWLYAIRATDIPAGATERESLV